MAGVGISPPYKSRAHKNRVHWNRMKNITLSADQDLIERARDTARRQRTTLNAAFREWLIHYTSQRSRLREFDTLMRRLKYVNTGGRRFTRDELNER